MVPLLDLFAIAVFHALATKRRQHYSRSDPVRSYSSLNQLSLSLQVKETPGGVFVERVKFRVGR
jgi:hypothetical protein